jgi:curved DNA-binding protein CbpA
VRYDEAAETAVAFAKIADQNHMKGTLTVQPLAELIREASTKGLSGTLRLEHERVQVAVYFYNGQVIYAAANLRTLRLREYLKKRSPGAAQNNEPENLSDLELAAKLAAKGTLKRKELDSLLEVLASDILRVALLWTEGSWDFNEKARLNDPVHLKMETATLVREAGQRLPASFISQRFRNPAELITRSADIPQTSFSPAESFLLSRLDQPMRLDELTALSGLREPEAQRVIYALALNGVVIREHWQKAFRTEGAKPAAQAIPETIPDAPQPTNNWTSANVEDEDLEQFLQRLSKATNHYEVIELTPDATTSEIKEAYYAMARRYHPDRFHLKSGTKLHAQISSAFARVTQAYETLMNANTRAAHDHTVERTRKIAAAKSAAVVNSETSGGEKEFLRADESFREGVGALEQGRIRAAITHLANSARLEPKEARYRAYYGRALAASESTRRLAENEIQAAVKLEPSNAEFRTMLAELYFELKFHRRAQTELDRALAIDPKHVAAHSLLRKLQKSRKVG